MSTEKLCFDVLGLVWNDRQMPEDDNWGEVLSEIRLDSSQFDEDAVWGLDEFSHLEVIYVMHLVDTQKITRSARRPRNISTLPEVGILAQRPKARPNRMGLSRCEICSVDGLSIFVRGLDAINGSPVLDIKPYFKAFAPRTKVREPDWVSEVVKNYY